MQTFSELVLTHSCIHKRTYTRIEGERERERERERKREERWQNGKNWRNEPTDATTPASAGKSKWKFKTCLWGSVSFIGLHLEFSWKSFARLFYNPPPLPSHIIWHARSTLWRNSKPVVQCSVPLFSSPAPFKFLFEGITWKNTKRNKRSKWLSIKLSCPSTFLISSYQNTINCMVIYRKIYDFNRPKSFPQFVSLHFIRNRFQKKEPNS